MDDTPLGSLSVGRGRPELVAEVARVLAVLPTGSTAVVACSGGPDSSALAHLVVDARPDLKVKLAHVRHGLRDDEADAEVVRTHARWLELEVVVSSVEVIPDGRGIEAAARDARYAALRAVARNCGAVGILVGHTADDQAETVLMRMARGTGIDGLSAMESVAGDLIRPLLRLRREDVHRFVELEGLPTVVDPTNRDPQVRRAIVRHELLPMLSRVAPDPVGSLTRLADLARADAAALDRAAEPIAASVRRVGPVRAVADTVFAGVVSRDAGAALSRRVVRAILGELGGEPPDAATVSRVLALPNGSAASLPGPVEVTSAGGWRAFAPRTLPHSEPVVMAGVGRCPWAPAGVAISRLLPHHLEADAPQPSHPDGVGVPPVRPAQPAQPAFPLPGVWLPPPPDRDPPVLPPGATASWLVLALPADIGVLTIRHRLPGDRVRTAAGTRALQDVLVDAGAPRAVREIWPVVANEDGCVVWSPGYAADEDVLRAGRGSPASQLRVVVDSPTPTR